MTLLTRLLSFLRVPAPLPPAPGEIPDFALGFWDGWEHSEAGYASYICHGDWTGRDKDYWRGFHTGYLECRRTKERRL